MKKGHKFIFVVGGVMSGVGKGITTSSLGTILQAKGYKVNIAKADPYLNVDAGTMNPTEHGEVFVLNSGLETDQDMGNYERFLNRDLDDVDYMTSGMVYLEVIQKERALKYGGKCVEALPHIRDEITRRFVEGGKIAKSDVTIVEIGGTIGDYQNIMFLESARTLKLKYPNDVVFVLVSYMPIPSKLGEMKSKPTQNAIRQLNSYGINADFVIARADVPLDKKRKEKIAESCAVPVENVISAPDIESIYDVPINFEKDKIGDMLTRALKLPNRQTKLNGWVDFVKSAKKSQMIPDSKAINIAVVGKYFDTGDFVLSDAYVSVIEAVKFSAYKLGVKVKLHWINAKHFEKGSGIAGVDAKITKGLKGLSKFDGILVPGGFGETGIEGKINVITYAREKKIPYFGLCYGMQLMVIEHARNVLGLTDATTTEIVKHAKNPVIDIMEHQKMHLAEGRYGASMRLGSYPCLLEEGSIAWQAYKNANWINRKSDQHISKNSKGPQVIERHRHRYEVNPLYVEALEKAGLMFSGTSPDGTLMEIAELPKSEHPFFLGSQFHPELLARPLDPHPLFTAFIEATRKSKKAS